MKKSALALLCVFLLGTLVLPTVAQDHPPDPTKPFSCAMPISKRTQEAGCYLLATQNLSSLPSVPLFWHLYTYPTMETAPKGDAMNTVVEAHGKVWLFRIAPSDWKPSSGERVAVIGPLVLPPAKEFIARYMMDVAPAGPGHTPAHVHPGTEAWYIIGGQQCMQTPGKAVILRAGEGAFVPGGVPMVLAMSGTETRRSLVLVLHDASASSFRTLIDDWKPDVACPVS